MGVFLLSRYLKSAAVFIGVGGWEAKLFAACRIVPHKRIFLLKMPMAVTRKYF